MAKATQLETVEGKGIKIPIYSSPVHTNGKQYTSFLLSYYRLGKRIRERAKSLEIARKRAKTLIEELSGLLPDDVPFSAREAMSINHAVELLEPHDIPLAEAARKVADAEKLLKGQGSIEEAVRHFLAEKEKQQLPRITFGQLADDFLNSMRDPKTGKQLKLSYRYWQDCSARLGAAREVFRSVQLADIHTRDLEKHLNNLPRRVRTSKGVVTKAGAKRKVSGKTRNKYRATFCTLFAYARKLGYLPRGVPTEAEHMPLSEDARKTSEEANVAEEDIYTPKEMQSILDSLQERWIPYVAIGAFAGVRSAEIHRLDWKDVNLKERILTVGRLKSKVGTRRIIRISDQLAAWLKPHAQDSGWVCPHYSHDSTLGTEFKKAFDKTGVRRVHNGFRNSFASYTLADVKIPAEVAWQMNTSERKLRDNYLELVSPNQLKAWRMVLPKKKTT